MADTSINEFCKLFKMYNEILFTQLTDNPLTNIAELRCNVLNHLKKFASTFCRRQNFKDTDLFVPPTELNIALRWDKRYNSETNSFDTVRKHCTFQYVSILNTLQCLFQIESFRKIYFNNEHFCDSQYIKSFCCGCNCQTEAFFNKNPNAIKIGLFYDDFEIVCPLGSKTSVHKMGAIYFSILNLPTYFFSKIDHIYLCALFFTEDIADENSINTILNPIYNDLSELETEGIFAYDRTLKGTLVAVSHDNLGGNSLFGFQKSFSCGKYCRFCELNYHEMKETTLEMSESLRSSKFIMQSADLKFQNVLNNLQNYNMFKNGTVDIMHDILEGAVPFALKIFFKYLTEHKILTSTKIQSILYSYQYTYLDRKNKPTKITLKKNSKTSIGLYASQNWCLIVHVPFLFYEYKNKISDKKIWDLITSLLEVMRVIFSNTIPRFEADLLKEKIRKHLQIILDLGHSLLPKHHFMTHYPRVLHFVGPLVLMWCMRYESYHRNFTKIGRFLNNFSNLAKTLALRHQQKQYQKLKAIDFDIKYKFGKKQLYSASDYHLINNLLDLSLYKYTVSYVECGFIYKKGFFIVSNEKDSNNNLKFCKIENVLVNEKSEIAFICKLFITKTYSSDYCAYEINESDTVSVIFFDDLKLKSSYNSLKTFNSEFIVSKTLINIF